MEPVSEEQLDAAINKRKDYVLQNLHTLTMKQFRGLLERDLSLPESALKGIKDIVQTKVDEVVSAHESKEGRQAEAPEGKVCSSKTVIKRQEEKRREKPRKKQKREDAAEAGPAAGSGPREYSKRVQKMRAICRQAGIAIPPNVYSKHKTDTSLEGAFEGLLEKYGLHRKSTQAEIAAAHRRLQKEKDMEGIDISNIVEGGRRARNRVDYSTVLKPKYEDISEDSGSPQEDDEDDGSIDGSDDASEASNRENIGRANASVEKRKQLGKRKHKKESEEEDQQQDSSGSDADADAGQTEAGNSAGKKAAEQHYVKSSGKKVKQAAEQKLVKSPSTKETRASEQKGVKSPSKTKPTEQNHVKSPGKEKKRTAEQNGVKSPVAQTQSPAPSPKKLSAKKALSTAEKPPKRQMLADWSDDE